MCYHNLEMCYDADKELEKIRPTTEAKLADALHYFLHELDKDPENTILQQYVLFDYNLLRYLHMLDFHAIDKDWLASFLSKYKYSPK
ncbi:MAG TPA: hypothetical protein VHA52_02170 [Candidatus Babeliaceae bacterium]|nr:hypothetical protein [Candidatus Babeliaceae bacterium]